MLAETVRCVCVIEWKKTKKAHSLIQSQRDTSEHIHRHRKCLQLFDVGNKSEKKNEEKYVRIVLLIMICCCLVLLLLDQKRENVISKLFIALNDHHQCVKLVPQFQLLLMETKRVYGFVFVDFEWDSWTEKSMWCYSLSLRQKFCLIYKRQSITRRCNDAWCRMNGKWQNKSFSTLFTHIFFRFCFYFLGCSLLIAFRQWTEPSPSNLIISRYFSLVWISDGNVHAVVMLSK